MFPVNVIDNIVRFALANDLVTLAQVDNWFKHSVYSKLYLTIIVIDSCDESVEIEAPQNCTVLFSHQLHQFAANLTESNLVYLREIVVNTHRSGPSVALLELYEKLASLWTVCSHQIRFVTYDIVALRATGSLNNYLEHNLLLHFEGEDDVLTSKNGKIVRLKNWLMADMSQFLRAPLNPDLAQLSFFVENNFHQDRLHSNEVQEPVDLSVPRENLRALSTLYLHTPLSFLKFMQMLQDINAPQMKLRTLSLTSSHRLVNDARLDFQKIMLHFDLNEVEELELRINCARRHECADSCMIQFFEQWKRYNSLGDKHTRLRKLSIVHHKSMAELSQFKAILENYVFSPLFAEMLELYVNFSNSSRPTQTCSIDYNKVIANLHHVPNLSIIHLSSFFCEWISGVASLLKEQNLSFYHALTNRCACQQCNGTRGAFTKLAELDRSNNYNHKIKMSDVSKDAVQESWIDFSNEANIKFLHYIGNELRKEEATMEQNLASTGTMLDMKHMPVLHHRSVEPFKELLVHSCLSEIYNKMAAGLVHLQKINFGGITLGH